MILEIVTVAVVVETPLTVTLEELGCVGAVVSDMLRKKMSLATLPLLSLAKKLKL